MDVVIPMGVDLCEIFQQTMQWLLSFGLPFFGCFVAFFSLETVAFLSDLDWFGNYSERTNGQNSVKPQGELQFWTCLSCAGTAEGLGSGMRLLWDISSTPHLKPAVHPQQQLGLEHLGWAGPPIPPCPGLSQGGSGAELCLCHIPGTSALPALGEGVPVHILQNVCAYK